MPSVSVSIGEIKIKYASLTGSVLNFNMCVYEYYDNDRLKPPLLFYIWCLDYHYEDPNNSGVG
jgi:hypothetical protein